MRVTKRALATLILTAAGFGLGGCGGGGGGGKFASGVPGGTPLGGLTPAQADQICRDQQRFLTQPSFEMDSCRITAFLSAAALATVSPPVTDAELQQTCAATYDACLHPDPGTGPRGPTCSGLPANCTATVAELSACLNDQAAANHELAAALPTCDAVTHAGFTENDGGIGTVGTLPPASCQTFVTKCSVS